MCPEGKGPRTLGGGGGGGQGILSVTGADPLTFCLPPVSSGQKYLTTVVKLFGPLTRNYYVRAVLHFL